MSMPPHLTLPPTSIACRFSTYCSRSAGFGVLLFGLLSLAGCQRAGERPEASNPAAGATEPARVEVAIETLAPNEVVERRIAPGETHLYELPVERDDFLEIEVEQQGVDLVVSLYDPRREQLLKTDLPIADLGSERLLAVFEETGEYRLTIEAWESDVPEGGYRVSMTLRPASDSDRVRARAAKIFYEAEQLAWAGELGAAAERYEDAQTEWRETEDAFGLAMALDRQGDAFNGLGLWRSSVEAHEQAANLFSQLGEARFEAISLSHLAIAFRNLGELEKAFENDLRALELRRRVGDRRGTAIALGSLATIYKIQGETQRALDHFSEALELFDANEDRLYIAPILHDLGTLYRRAGEHQLAMDYLRQAGRAFTELAQTSWRAASMSQLGQLALEMGDFDQALLILDRALELRRQNQDPRGEAVVLRRIGSVYQALGKLEEARRRFLRALEISNNVESPRTEALVLTSLGFLHGETESPEQALASHRQALALFEDIGDPMGQAENLLGIAISKRRVADFEGARLAGEKALTVAESLRVKPFSEGLRFSFFSTAQRFFEFYIDLMMELEREMPGGGYAAAALEVSERARARSLLDLLVESDAEIRDDAASELLEEEQRLQKQLNAASMESMENEAATARQRQLIQDRIRRILVRLGEVRGRIRQQSPRYAALTQPQPLSLRQIQQEVLDAETVLLEYKLGSERSFLWLARQDSLSSFEIGPGEEIERAAREVHRLVSLGYRQETEPRIRDLLCDLSHRLVGPVVGSLGQMRLAIVADGALQYLPFSALPDPDSSEDCSEAAPLVAAHEIVYLPSASTLAIQRRDRNGPAPTRLVAVLADPVFTPDDERVVPPPRSSETDAETALTESDQTALGKGLAAPVPERLRRLRHSSDEATSILSLVPSELGYLASGFSASKKAVVSGLLTDFQIVHFATHATVDALHPELSRVVLSLVDRHGRPVDGRIMAHEIYNLRLPADLVALGACETALGKEVRGEGLVGFTRGFMYAGASRVLVSLWRVSDRSTSEMMTAFYRALLAERLAPVSALRAAQLAVREVRPHPFYWAGFVLQGEWRPMNGRIQ